MSWLRRRRPVKGVRGRKASGDEGGRGAQPRHEEGDVRRKDGPPPQHPAEQLPATLLKALLLIELILADRPEAG